MAQSDDPLWELSANKAVPWQKSALYQLLNKPKVTDTANCVLWIEPQPNGQYYLMLRRRNEPAQMVCRGDLRPCRVRATQLKLRHGIRISGMKKVRV